MKKIVMLSFALSLVCGAAYADQVCGLVGSHLVGPVCEPGQACPAFERVQITITPPGQAAVDVSTSDYGVFQSLQQLIGSQACAQGTPVATGGFEISAIAAQE